MNTIEQQKNNPLHGIKLEALLTELVKHYGFDILAEQININCFKVNASIKSSLKFLRKTQWARDKVEAFYLYKYKSLPKPSDEQHEFPPRERLINAEQKTTKPALIELGDSEFFDDPVTGRKPSEKQYSQKKPARRPTLSEKLNEPLSAKPSVEKQASTDPWARWKEKNQ